MDIIKKLKRSHLILFFILLAGLFFRTYKIVDRFEFAHDADLYSWIVKDILVNHHFRLIGQLTSAPGIFIGPLFYYLIAPFFVLFKMDPIGAAVPAIIIGICTIFSFYFVLSKVFNKDAGIIGAFLYAVLTVTVSNDRWMVPTITTSIWTIWYFYAILMLSEGNFSVLWLLGLLVGLIWDIHIALIPTLVAIPVAMWVAKKMPSLKQSLRFLITFFLTSLPLILFEVRHHFSQTISLMNNFKGPSIGPTGIQKFQLVLGMIAKNLNALLLAPQSLNLVASYFLLLAILISPFFLIKKKILSIRQVIPLYAWILGVIFFFSLSSSPISEYYFTNLNIIFLALVTLLWYLLYKSSQIGKMVLFLVLGIVFLKNSYFLINQSYYNKGYVEKKALVKYISEDAASRGFPCIGISYITTPGENVGFRYFFYLSNQHLVHPSLDVAVYNIVIPEELSKETKFKFGHIGLIPPTSVPSKDKIEKSCQTPNTNLTDPVLGYTE